MVVAFGILLNQQSKCHSVNREFTSKYTKVPANLFIIMRFLIWPVFNKGKHFLAFERTQLKVVLIKNECEY